MTSLATARQSAAVSYQRAKNAGAEWIVAAKLPLDLRGHVLDLVTFATEEDCRFFYPRRALIWQQMVNTAIKKQLSRREFKINSIVITREQYARWLARRADSPQLRRESILSRIP